MLCGYAHTGTCHWMAGFHMEVCSIILSFQINGVEPYNDRHIRLTTKF